MVPDSTSGWSTELAVLAPITGLSGNLRVPKSQSGTAFEREREVRVRVMDTVREPIRRPNEKKGIERPSGFYVQSLMHSTEFCEILTD